MFLKTEVSNLKMKAGRPVRNTVKVILCSDTRVSASKVVTKVQPELKFPLVSPKATTWIPHKLMSSMCLF